MSTHNVSFPREIRKYQFFLAEKKKKKKKMLIWSYVVFILFSDFFFFTRESSPIANCIFNQVVQYPAMFSGKKCDIICLYLRGLHTLGKLSAISAKGGNFCNFLLALMQANLLKRRSFSRDQQKNFDNVASSDIEAILRLCGEMRKNKSCFQLK